MYILYLILALLILLLMVTIHEFGHYTAGKLLGFKINEFSIGFGKALFSKKKKSGEIFSIRLVPLGGYCAFEGEEDDSDNPQAFMKQKPWKRLIVLFSGAFFNFLSAIIFSVILLCGVGYDIPQVATVDSTIYFTTENVLLLDDKINAINEKQIKGDLFASQLGNYLALNLEDFELNDKTSGTLQITFTRNGENQEQSQTESLGYVVNSNQSLLKKGDVVYKINGEKISFITNNTFSSLFTKNVNNSEMTLNVKRDGKKIDVNANLLKSGIPYKVYLNKETNSKITYKAYEKLTQEQQQKYELCAEQEYAKALGITMKPYKFSFGEALINSVPYTFGFAWKVLESLGLLITGQLALNSIGGPLTTITTMATFTQTNFSSFFVLLPLIAANLAVFNWLPFPALDGSKMVFTVIEMIRGKPINQKVENTIHTVGLFLLFALVIIADLYHIFTGIR